VELCGLQAERGAEFLSGNNTKRNEMEMITKGRKYEKL
jgi:hypothetical protein